MALRQTKCVLKWSKCNSIVTFLPFQKRLNISSLIANQSKYKYTFQFKFSLLPVLSYVPLFKLNLYNNNYNKHYSFVIICYSSIALFFSHDYSLFFSQPAIFKHVTYLNTRLTELLLAVLQPFYICAFSYMSSPMLIVFDCRRVWEIKNVNGEVVNVMTPESETSKVREEIWRG